jgi:LmbE family N-acetylglucosaminyl deacetylase
MVRQGAQIDTDPGISLKPERLLIITAHPDDEAFAAAATAARYAQEGRTVALATLTGGGGSVWCGKDPDDLRSLSEVRRAELACAAARLGIGPVFMLDYPDGSLSRIASNPSLRSRVRTNLDRISHRRGEPPLSMQKPRDRLLADLLRITRCVRPQVMLTFGPDGLMGGHADHRATHRLVRLVWQAAQQEEPAPRKLYYLTASAATAKADNLPRPPPITTHVYVREFQDRKREAFECYASQRHERARLERFIKGQGDWEVYSRAAGPASRPDSTGLETDLFG